MNTSKQTSCSAVPRNAPVTCSFSPVRITRRTLRIPTAPRAAFSAIGTFEEDGMGDALPLTQVAPAAAANTEQLPRSMASNLSAIKMLTHTMDEDGMAGDSPLLRLQRSTAQPLYESDTASPKVSATRLGNSGLQLLRAAAASAVNFAQGTATPVARDPIFESTMSDEEGDASAAAITGVTAAGTLIDQMRSAGLAAMSKAPFSAKVK